MSTDVIEIPMEHVIPAGALGSEPVTLDVRAYLVPHEPGLVLVERRLRGARMCFAHGPELDQPWDALDLLIAR